MSELGIKCVLFDFGDVLCRAQKDSCIKEMITLSGISESDFSRAFFEDRSDYDQNLLDGRAYWKRLLDRQNISLSEETIDRLIALDLESWFAVDDRMITLAFELQAAGIAIGVLSNMPIEHAVAYRKGHAWMERFDHLFLSAEFGLVKPTSEIYEYVLDRVNCNANEILFVDDKEENLVGAAKLGIRGYHYTRERSPGDLAAHFGLGSL